MFPARDQTTDTTSMTPTGDRFAKVTEQLKKGVADGVYPGAVLLVGHLGNIVYHFQVGSKWQSPPEGIKNEMARDTVFDVASVTQGVITTTLMMKAVESGKIKLEDRICRFIPEFGVLGKSSITIEQLLSHSSGLAAWAPFFEDLVKANGADRLGILTSRGAREFIYQTINRSELKFAPGSKQLLSDLGFLLVGSLLELVYGAPLDKIAYKEIFQPLGLKSSSYIDLAMVKRRGIAPVMDRIAPTEECPWRHRILCGEVHDDNAWAMGGIAGHSGLFTNAHDLHIFAAEMLRAYRGASDFLRRETVMRFWTSTPALEVEALARLGWEVANKENAMTESTLTPNAIGHNGFTGCSLWIEPQLGIDIILLTNRVHPSRSNKQIRGFRPELHAAVLEAIANNG